MFPQVLPIAFWSAAYSAALILLEPNPKRRNTPHSKNDWCGSLSLRTDLEIEGVFAFFQLHGLAFARQKPTLAFVPGHDLHITSSWHTRNGEGSVLFGDCVIRMVEYEGASFYPGKQVISNQNGVGLLLQGYLTAGHGQQSEIGFRIDLRDADHTPFLRHGGGILQNKLLLCGSALVAIEPFGRSEEHTSELQSRGLISYAV